ncbi:MULTISPECIES: hypothetical protein [Chryseobacterium]|uniref:Uncharacterized protein n=1 Tax=Chryseobacterium nepalense TaxID=1854498 RepID=A0ABY4K3V5_9FLAO|nr:MULTISPECIES: hypothetical protein [Chryseobacterium]UPQ74503.1 hypothetical protein M0D58_10610 [Chryseobacterium nepalense]
MKKIMILAGFLFSLSICAQVGINNTSPQATLDITAKATDGSSPQGIIAPRLTGDQIQAGDGQYKAAQTGAIIYATAAVTTPSAKTANISSQGYYYFDGSVWQKIGVDASNIASSSLIKRVGASYSSLVASDISKSINTLSIITSAPSPRFNLTALTATDLGKVLYIQNNSGNNFDIRYIDDLSVTVDYTLQNTRGAVFIWGGNGWLRGSY